MGRVRRIIGVLAVLAAAGAGLMAMPARATGVKKISPNKYASRYCDDVTAYNDVFDEWVGVIGDPNLSATEYYDGYVDGVDNLVKAIKVWQKSAAKVEPKMQGGHDIATALRSTLEDLHGALADAQSRLGDIDPSGADFGTTIEQISVDLEGAHSTTTSAIDDALLTPLSETPAIKAGCVDAADLVDKANALIAQADPDKVVDPILGCIDRVIDDHAPAWSDVLDQPLSGPSADPQAVQQLGELVQDAAAGCGVQITIAPEATGLVIRAA